MSAPKEQGGYTVQLRLLGSARGFGAAVAPRKFFYSTSCIDKLLFARKKRMAGSANADFNVPTCRTGVIDRATGTDNIGLIIFWMNTRFHGCEGTRNLRVGSRFRKR